MAHKNNGTTQFYMYTHIIVVLSPQLLAKNIGCIYIYVLVYTKIA